MNRRIIGTVLLVSLAFGSGLAGAQLQLRGTPVEGGLHLLADQVRLLDAEHESSPLFYLITVPEAEALVLRATVVGSGGTGFIDFGAVPNGNTSHLNWVGNSITSVEFTIRTAGPTLPMLVSGNDGQRVRIILDWVGHYGDIPDDTLLHPASE